MTITWDDVDKKLKSLMKQDLPPAVMSLVLSVKQLSDSRMPKYTPEAAQAMLSAIPLMAENEIKGSTSPKAVLAMAAAKFAQSGWTVDEVNNVSTHIDNNYNLMITEEAFQKLHQQGDPTIEVPVVLLVMSRAEAKKLNDGTAFAGLPANFQADFQQDFAALKQMLPADWVDSYGAKPQNWKPFSDKPDTIKEWIDDRLAQVRADKQYSNEIVPQFINIAELNKDRSRLVNLREKGCIVIEDAVSMRYPPIQQEYRRSLLDAFKQIIIIRIVPQVGALNCVNQPILTWVQHFSDIEFWQRRITGDDRCREVFMSVDFLGWFNQHVPNLIPNDEKIKNTMTGEVVGTKR